MLQFANRTRPAIQQGPSGNDAAPSIWCSRCDRPTERKNIMNPDGKMCKDRGERIYDIEIAAYESGALT
ncbi:hypothetical protein AUG19_05925 [archaeon 13_1_20CM_2_54_9]|nr:MAG: hypothetical protein AUG19_05925 [archaeon 13_1_20CM_2_54_9]